MAKYLIAAILLVVSSISAYAQGGSNYSVFGIGDIFSGANASYQAMGGTNIAVEDFHSIAVKNPALWSTAMSTRLMTGYSFNQHLNEDNDATLYQNNGQISGLYSIFSIDTSRGIALSFGIHSYSKVNYLIQNSFVVEKDGLSQTGKNTFSGKGGLSSIYLGASSNIISGLAAGASAFAIFGPITHDATTSFEQSYTYNYTTSKSDYANGWGTRLGLYYTGIKNLGLGFYYEHIGNLDFDRDTTYSSDLLNDTIIKSSFTTPMPSTLGFGLSYRTGKFLIAADAQYSDFSKFDYNKGARSEFRTAGRYSIGVNRFGNLSRSVDYLDRVGYKFGLSYQDLYYSIDGQDINEFALSFGANMPVGLGGFLDVAFTFGTRGFSTDNLINEYFGKMSVEISIGEIWFIPFKKKY